MRRDEAPTTRTHATTTTTNQPQAERERDRRIALAEQEQMTPPFLAALLWIVKFISAEVKLRPSSGRLGHNRNSPSARGPEFKSLGHLSPVWEIKPERRLDTKAQLVGALKMGRKVL